MLPIPRFILQGGCTRNSFAANIREGQSLQLKMTSKLKLAGCGPLRSHRKLPVCSEIKASRQKSKGNAGQSPDPQSLPMSELTRFSQVERKKVQFV